MRIRASFPKIPFILTNASIHIHSPAWNGETTGVINAQPLMGSSTKDGQGLGRLLRTPKVLVRPRAGQKAQTLLQNYPRN